MVSIRGSHGIWAVKDSGMSKTLARAFQQHGYCKWYSLLVLALLSLLHLFRARTPLAFRKTSSLVVPTKSFYDTSIAPSSVSKQDSTLVWTNTDPSFQIWLYPPQDDIISKHIQNSGLYEPDGTTRFVQSVTAAISKTQKHTDGLGWAVDIGANVGFHSLHMAMLGMDVIALEPSPDTAALLRRSIQINNLVPSRSNQTSTVGRVHLVEAAAADRPGMGRLIRHPDSPGMTILQRTDEVLGPSVSAANSPSDRSLPFGIHDVIGIGIPLVEPRTVIAEMVGKGDSTVASRCTLLKVDAEGYEMQAFRGVNLDRYPFRYVTFEFFPELLIRAGNTDPLDLLLYIQSFGYACCTNPLSLFDNISDRITAKTMTTIREYQNWYQRDAIAAYNKSNRFHVNLYCQLLNVIHQTSNGD